MTIDDESLKNKVEKALKWIRTGDVTAIKKKVGYDYSGERIASCCRESDCIAKVGNDGKRAFYSYQPQKEVKNDE